MYRIVGRHRLVGADDTCIGTGRWCGREKILGYLGDFELIEPGLVSRPGV
jgi:hypothetical protein